MPPRLGERAHCPADVPEQLEDAQLLEGDARASQLRVAIEERARLRDAAQPELLLPEPPGAYQGPGQVLARIADMREHPIEHAGEPCRAHQEVADAEVAVADGA